MGCRSTLHKLWPSREGRSSGTSASGEREAAVATLRDTMPRAGLGQMQVTSNAAPRRRADDVGKWRRLRVRHTGSRQYLTNNNRHVY